MPDSLRATIEADLETTVEGDFALPCVIISPEGQTETLQGMVLYDYVKVNPQDGAEVVVHEPQVSLRRSSLITAFGQVPQERRGWFFRIPPDPNVTDPAQFLTLELIAAPIQGRSIGTVTFRPTKAVQS